MQKQPRLQHLFCKKTTTKNGYPCFVTKKNWGISNSTSLIDFKSGENLWDIKKIFYSIHIIKDVLIFKNSTNKFTAIDINSGIEKFSLKSPFKWSTTKTFLLNGKFYLFSSKRCLMSLSVI